MPDVANTAYRPISLYRAIQRCTSTVSAFCQKRWIPWVLFALALARNVVLLMAYPPAHGADSLVYFVYAERFLGFNVPTIADLAPPLYSLLILLTYKVLGSIYWLIALQFVLSAVLPPLGYFIGRRYQPILGLMMGLVILGDVQVAVVYNFTSTEPLYIFLLLLMYWGYLRLADLTLTLKQGRLAFFVGMLLQLLVLTRAISRYLILPLEIIFIVITRRYRLAVIMFSGFLAATALYILLTLLVFGRIEGFTTSNLNMMTIFLVKPEWVESENGINSATYLAGIADCPYHGYGKMTCLRERLDSWEQIQAVLGGTFAEMVRRHPLEYLSSIWDQMNGFLSLSGQQFGLDAQTPNEIQCREAANLNVQPPEIGETHWSMMLPDFTPESVTSALRLQDQILNVFCPSPIQSNETARELVDTIAERYRSLGRPLPLLWYGSLFVLVLVLPFARKYQLLVLSGLAILFNHAILSALVLSVQPRYVAVINPIRAILLLVLLFIVVEGVFRLSAKFFTRGTAGTITPTA